MRNPLLIIFVFIAHVTFSQGAAREQGDSLANAFDFWIGEWQVSWNSSSGETGRGTNRIEKTLDGKVLQEHFVIEEGQGAGFEGTSISVYQPAMKQWYQSWADNQGGYYHFEGIVDGKSRIFQTPQPIEISGKSIIFRMVFYNIEKNSFTWDWERSTDGGASWALSWRIFYTRKGTN